MFASTLRISFKMLQAIEIDKIEFFVDFHFFSLENDKEVIDYLKVTIGITPHHKHKILYKVNFFSPL